MSGLSLHVVIKFVNANTVFPCAIEHCVRIPMLNMFISDGLSPPLGLCLLAQSLWRESNVLDSWQLTMLPLSELCEFNPRWVRDNLSASLWVIIRFPQPEKKTIRTFMYVCVRACMCTCIYACLHVCLHARVSVRTHASTVVLSNIYGEAYNI